MTRDIMIQCLNSDIDTLKGLLNRGIPTEDNIKTEIETKTAIIELLKVESCEMREPTEQERKSVNEYVESISKPTGLTAFSKPCEDVVSRDYILARYEEYCKANCAYSEKQRESMCRACMMGDAQMMVEDTPSVTLSIPTSTDCVSRADLEEMKSPMYDSSGNMIGYGVLMEDVRKMNPVTPKRPKGMWIKEESIYGWDGKSYQCSVCGRSIHLDTKAEDLKDYSYCHCGADMREEQNESNN